MMGQHFFGKRGFSPDTDLQNGVLMKKRSLKHKGKSSLEMARLIARIALEKKAENIVLLDVERSSTFTDYFVIMSGRSTRHVQGLADSIDAEMHTKRIKAAKAEGMSEGFWVLLDYGDVVVHIFYHETRDFFDLEGLWHDAPRISMDAGPGKQKKNKEMQ